MIKIPTIFICDICETQAHHFSEWSRMNGTFPHIPAGWQTKLSEAGELLVFCGEKCEKSYITQINLKSLLK